MSRKPLSVAGKVIHGDKLARNLGFPTINLEITKDINLDFGIYAGVMIHNNITYKGVISYGMTPHFKQKTPKLEIHLFNFNSEIYGEFVEIIFIEFIRSEQVFNNHEELIAAINKDCSLAKKILD